ncbi:hypothetical protein BN13_140058 [Nostocoides jenkinsii Ben 74]|uniref:Uncharacterized protein n=1 Tax=Nostocoides jenkinsii Ben 74 TaxID=1193518 RepID=A0A077M4A9_9MICO|nr:hypothetical protein BN13_140058 [Tetrasphaera jenkinsii Ben 74]
MVASRAEPTTRSGLAMAPYCRPPIVAVPSDGRIKPSSIRKVVVLPAPFGPRKPVTRPGSTVKVRSRTAVKSPNRLDRLWNSICDGGAGGAVVIRFLSNGFVGFCH